MRRVFVRGCRAVIQSYTGAAGGSPKVFVSLFKWTNSFTQDASHTSTLPPPVCLKSPGCRVGTGWRAHTCIYNYARVNNRVLILKVLPTRCHPSSVLTGRHTALVRPFRSFPLLFSPHSPTNPPQPFPSLSLKYVTDLAFPAATFGGFMRNSRRPGRTHERTCARANPHALSFRM